MYFRSIVKQVLQHILITLDTSFLHRHEGMREASFSLLMLSGKQGRHWYYFYVFGMMRRGFEPATSRTRSGRSTTRLSRWLKESAIWTVLLATGVYYFTKQNNFIILHIILKKMYPFQVDVIVNNTGKALNLRYGAVSASILKKGGVSVQQELKQKYPKGLGDDEIAVTSGGNMNCSFILHGCLMPWDGGAEASKVTI